MMAAIFAPLFGPHTPLNGVRCLAALMAHGHTAALLPKHRRQRPVAITHRCRFLIVAIQPRHPHRPYWATATPPSPHRPAPPHSPAVTALSPGCAGN